MRRHRRAVVEEKLSHVGPRDVQHAKAAGPPIVDRVYVGAGANEEIHNLAVAMLGRLDDRQCPESVIGEWLVETCFQNWKAFQYPGDVGAVSYTHLTLPTSDLV